MEIPIGSIHLSSGSGTKVWKKDERNSKFQFQNSNKSEFARWAKKFRWKGSKNIRKLEFASSSLAAPLLTLPHSLTHSSSGRKEVESINSLFNNKHTAPGESIRGQSPASSIGGTETRRNSGNTNREQECGSIQMYKKNPLPGTAQ